jgi:hypothetical protein
MAKSKTAKNSKGDLEILAPKRARQVAQTDRDPSVTTQSIQAWTAEDFFDIKKVDSKAMGADWKDKLDRVVEIAENAAEKKGQAWHIDEIEIGLTLSAKGELLFIAEAGVEATVKVVLKRTR